MERDMPGVSFRLYFGRNLALERADFVERTADGRIFLFFSYGLSIRIRNMRNIESKPTNISYF